MLIGVPSESATSLVAATPASVTALRRLGHEVAIAAGAGERSGFGDADYAEAGARVVSADQAYAAELVVKVAAPTPEELDRLAAGSRLVAQLAPAQSPALLAELAARDVTALALDAVPRISRAQSLDVLSSMANLAGYRAVVEAAHAFGGMLGGQVTAAGKVPPARVFVVGAGVAGLAAIGAAQSLGAEVRAFDVRPEVAEQVASMGAVFVPLDVQTTGRADGYAQELSGDAEAAAAELYAREAAAADIVIATALIPGRPAPLLIQGETVAAMRPGSVIVDLAAANGGNVSGTVAGQRTVTDNGVIILGWTDLPARLPRQASTLYARNVVNLVKLLTPGGDGQLVLDLDDQVQRGMLVSRNGEVAWPPPPVAVSAQPAAPPDIIAEPADPAARGPGRIVTLVLLAIVGVVLAAQLESVLGSSLVIFALAVVLGFYVILQVTHALHTPLMSITNAISGMILVGAMLEVGNVNPLIAGLSMIGIFLASINVFGGFWVTGRMLAMFRRSE